MIYLSEFHFPGEDREWSFFARQQRTCYDSYYPFQLFPARGLRALELADVTILYGGNGSGKTTALNVMAETLRLRRVTPVNPTNFFPDDCGRCSAHLRPRLAVSHSPMTSASSRSTATSTSEGMSAVSS